MSNINVRVVGTANVTQMSAAFGKLQAQVTALNAQMAQMVSLQNGVDPTGYSRMSKAAAKNANTFRNAAASTGMFEIQQLKLNKATDDYVSKLQKQQMSFRQMMKDRRIASAAFKEQLAMQNMMVRQNPGSTAHGKSMVDVIIPKEVASEMRNAGNQTRFFSEQLKSGGHQMVNWGKNTQWAGRQLMVGFTMPLAAAGAAAGVLAYKLDKEFTRVRKVYDTTADQNNNSIKSQMALEQEYADLRAQGAETAKHAANEYGQAAESTLGVQAELAAVGLKGQQLQESTAEVMRISTLGEVDQSVATKTLIAVQQTLNATTEETATAFDYLNSIENATSLATADFAQAIPRALGPMKEMSAEGATAQEVLENLSVLMVAMKERGIAAGEGANAIKSLMGRVYRPSAQVASEWQAMGLGDPRNFAKQGKDVIEVLQMVSERVKDLKGAERTKALAGLFGIHQVARMNAMLKGLEGVNQEGSQVARVFQTIEAGSGDWAETSAGEIEEWQKSVSGQFKRAVETFKTTFAEFGTPFLQTATYVLKFLNKLMEGFNGLSKTTKIIAGVAVGFMALAGPIIMLIGLFGNLMGQGVTVLGHLTGAIAKLMGAEKLMTKEQKAAAMMADLQNTALAKQTSAAQLLTIQLQKLALAQRAANAEAASDKVAAMTAGGSMSRSAAYRQLANERRNELKSVGLMNNAGVSTSYVAGNTDKVAKSAGVAAANWKKVGVGAATAASMGALMFMHSEGIVGQAAKLIFFASLLGPILTPLGPILVKGFKAATTQAVILGGAMKTNLATASATSTAMAAGGAAAGKHAAGAHKAATKWSILGGVVAGFFKTIWNILKVVSKAMGWVGWLIVGAGAVYTIWKKIRGENEKAQAKQTALIKEQRKGADSIAKAAENYAAAAGTALRDLKAISTASLLPQGGKPMDERIERWKSDDRSQYIDTFKAATSTANTEGKKGPVLENSGQYKMALQQFYDLQVKNRLSAKEAAQEIRAMYIAAGKSAFEADYAAKNLLDTYGNVNKASSDTKIDLLKNLADITRAPSDPEALRTGARQLFMQFAHEFENAAAGPEAQQMFAPMHGAIGSEWDEAFGNLDQKYKDALAKVGVTSGEGFKKFTQNLQKAESEGRLDPMYDNLIQKNRDLRDELAGEGKTFSTIFTGASEEAQVFEQEIIKTAKETYNLKGEYANLQELFKDPLFSSKTNPITQSGVKEYLADVNGMINSMRQPEGWGGKDDTTGAREEERAKLIHQMAQVAQAHDLATGKIDNMADALIVLNSTLPKNNNILTDYEKRVRDVSQATKFWHDLEKSGAVSESDAGYVSAMTQRKGLLKEMKGLLQENGVKTKNIKTVQQALVALQKMFNTELAKAPAKIDDATRNANALAAAMRKAFQFSAKDVVSIQQEGMRGVQEQIAEDWREAFDTRMSNALESRQAHWDKRQEGLTAEIERNTDALDRRHERATKGMERRQENQNAAMDARHERESRSLDNKWESKIDAAENYWDRRAKAVDKAIEREQRAEELRQKMFDAEIARINKLNDMANRNIDFNMAINTGDLDEAAKIRNDAEASETQSVLERAKDQGSARADRRINRLEGRRDAIDEAREKHLRSLEKRAEAEKRHLQQSQERQKKHLQRQQERESEMLRRSQEREKKHLEKVNKQREKALQEEAENDMETQRKIWERRKKSLEKQLETFLKFIAANERQLKKHMQNVGLSYHKFGKDVLEPKGKRWATYFGDQMKEKIRNAGLALASDKMWEVLGKKSTKGLVKGIGFKDFGEFRHFIKTGEMGGGGKGDGDGGGGGGSGKQKRHEGGIIGSGGKDSRKGVARTQKGLHPSEQMVLAQKGEFVVNRDSAERNLELLFRLNKGENVHNLMPMDAPSGYDGGKGPAGAKGGGGSAAGFMSAIVSKMLMQGLGKSIETAHATKAAEMAAIAASFGAGDGGVFGGRSFSKAQLKHAATIANVGAGMGMSARDIMIGIMTAITESGLVNVNYGDRDSLGLFQQRPSMGWGSPAQVTDPQYAARQFFSRLKGVGSRGGMDPWVAAQSVQRSAFSDGSNFRKWWNAAQAVYKNGLVKKNGSFSASAGVAGGKYVPGKGGWHPPAIRGKGWSNSHDYRNGLMSPLFAAADGTIISSKATTSGGSPGNGQYRDPITGKGYTSYGEQIVLRTGAGDLRYAHLHPGHRYVKAGQRVKGGSLIGRSGNTGNSTGPHTHFDVSPGWGYNASGWLASRGISLRKGTEHVNFDNTIANLHKGETVLTKNISERFREGVDNFASGGNSEYNVHVHVNGTNATAEEITNKVITTLKRLDSRKPQSRRS